MKNQHHADTSKQTQEVIFSRKIIKATHTQIFFRNIPHFKIDYQKIFELLLDSKPFFHMYIKTIITVVNKPQVYFKNSSGFYQDHLQSSSTIFCSGGQISFQASKFLGVQFNLRTWARRKKGAQNQSKPPTHNQKHYFLFFII